MKRFAFLTIVLIVIAASSGCRRGLRLWGLRGARCAPVCGAVVAPAAVPTAYPQFAVPTVPAACPPVVCPTYCPAPSYSIPAAVPTNCGCDTGSVIDPAYPNSGGIQTVPMSSSNWDIRPGEYLDATSIGNPNYVPSSSVVPANQSPVLPQGSPTTNLGFSG